MINATEKLYYLNLYQSIKSNPDQNGPQRIAFMNQIDYVLENSPYEYLLTLTYPSNLHKTDCQKMWKKFLSRLERKLFGKNNSDDFLRGFIFEETQPATDQIHHHMLIKHHDNFNLGDKPSIHHHFTKILRTLCHETASGRKVGFDPRHCDIAPVTQVETLVPYLCKSYKFDGNFDFVMPIERECS